MRLFWGGGVCVVSFIFILENVYFLWWNAAGYKMETCDWLSKVHDSKYVCCSYFQIDFYFYFFFPKVPSQKFRKCFFFLVLAVSVDLVKCFLFCFLVQ